MAYALFDILPMIGALFDTFPMASDLFDNLSDVWCPK